MLDLDKGELVAPGNLLIEGERIRGVAPASVPEDAAVIDLGDLTLLPGLMDMEVKFLLSPPTPAATTASDETLDRFIELERFLVPTTNLADGMDVSHAVCQESPRSEPVHPGPQVVQCRSQVPDVVLNSSGPTWLSVDWLVPAGGIRTSVAGRPDPRIDTDAFLQNLEAIGDRGRQIPTLEEPLRLSCLDDAAHRGGQHRRYESVGR
jgi:hypothetical protein